MIIYTYVIYVYLSIYVIYTNVIYVYMFVTGMSERFSYGLCKCLFIDFIYKTLKLMLKVSTNASFY